MNDTEEPIEQTTAVEYARLAGDAVTFFVYRIIKRPADDWSEAERAFMRGLVPIMERRKAAIESVIADLELRAFTPTDAQPDQVTQPKGGK